MGLPFVFGIHNHQPLGNFDHVIEKLTNESYFPFFKMALAHSHFRFSVHVSGILLRWWEDHHPQTFELLGKLVDRGQVELVCGGFFEPILAVIPREDRKEQILRHKDYLKRHFGQTPVGLWLTERVWEQALVEDLVSLGIKYVVVDDRHFIVSGFEKNDLYGYYLTEAEGKRLAVFPIDETLRYAIPFWPIERLANYLHDVQVRGGRLAIYFDDGEKFGVWPGTKEWVYEKGWLKAFLEALRRWQEEGRIEILTFAEALERIPAQGLAYLPTASYAEMEEWALPAKRILELTELEERLKPEKTRFAPFIRGGHWRNFLVKYPESNYLHKRVYQVSALSRGVRFDPEARLDLLAAQCNDAYWHGIFGGLYLPHLRQAVWEKLLSAEARLRRGEQPEIWAEDIDLDGQEEIISASEKAFLTFKPAYGGQIREWSSFKTHHNYQNVLTRRFEAYHEGIRHFKEAQAQEEREGVSSIHLLKKRPSREVIEALVYDWYERHTLIEHFFDPDRGLADFVRCDFGEWGDFANQPFRWHRSGAEILFFRDGGLYPPGSPRRPLLLRKRIKIEKGGLKIQVNYELEYRAEEETRCFFGVEFNFFPLFMATGEGAFLVDGKDFSWHEPKEGVGQSFVFHHPSERLRISLPQKTSFFLFPVKTVSQSEAGYDLTVQGLAFMPFWPLSLAKNQNKGLSLTLELK